MENENALLVIEFGVLVYSLTDLAQVKAVLGTFGYSPFTKCTTANTVSYTYIKWKSTFDKVRPALTDALNTAGLVYDIQVIRQYKYR